MKKENIVIGISVLFILIFCILSIVLYRNNIALGIERDNFLQEKDALSQEKEELLDEREGLRSEIDSLNSELDLLKDDLLRMSKSCISEGICRGRFPNVSWYCNVVGDEVSDPSHICYCDSSCNIKITEI